ncbi:hypothetical protein LCGC14_0368860 [marine sediment metagenome]|uniref:ABC transporter domain-containing protein n=1 Tax=marine sediment metagenome TaxID=412755 RepID=A0A0F9TBN1_9ZZZZ
MHATHDHVIVTVGLTKVFRDFWLREKVSAVADLDLQIEPGEVFGLLGPNGSGKTTTLNMLLGLLFPTRGRVAIFGRPATDVSIKARVGFLPEETYLYPFLDARETLDYYARLFHQPRHQRRRRIDMLLEMVGLSSVAYRRINEYSKGMQRRIGLAQALINDPDLLILDEPTSGMDPIGTREVKDLIGILAGRGKTVLLSSHLLADVEDVCDRVCVLYGGRQRAVGRIDELLAREAHTQITTDRLDDATLAKIRDVLAAGSHELLDVSTPRDKLESLFLRIVEEAQAKRLVTGGAMAGGPVAEFLRTGQDDDQQGRLVIEQLVGAEPPVEPVAEPPPPMPSPAAQADEDVLDELISADERADKDTPPPPADRRPAPSAKKQDQADQGVLDDLLGGDRSEESSS